MIVSGELGFPMHSPQMSDYTSAQRLSTTFVQPARTRPDNLGGKSKSGGQIFSRDVVCNTDNSLLLAFCYCSVNKTRVCLLFTTVKTFDDRSSYTLHRTCQYRHKK